MQGRRPGSWAILPPVFVCPPLPRRACMYLVYSREAVISGWGEVKAEMGNGGHVPGAAAVERLCDVGESQT